MEVLRKLLNAELKARAKRNLFQSKALLEMLKDAIKRYQNKVLIAAEVIDEQTIVNKEIIASESEAKQLGLSVFEYAFHRALASNESAKQLTKHDKLRYVAVVHTKKVRKNASIDWTIKGNVKVIVP